MKKLEISATSKTPLISIDPGQNEIVIKGRYLLHDIQEREVFINDVKQNIAELVPLMKENIKIEVYYLYVNTGNLNAYFSIFQTIELSSSADQTIVINWYFEGDDDDDTIERGEMLKEIVDCQVNLIDTGD